MDDENNIFEDAMRFAAENRLPPVSPLLTIDNDNRSRQQRRFEDRKGVRNPDRVAVVDGAATSAARLMALAGDRKDPTDPAAWGGKLNIYVCDRCQSHVVTRDLADGVTPFGLPSSEYCPNACGSDEPKAWINMTSSFYRVWNQSMREDYQWYRPKDAEPVEAAMREHVGKGGLLIRKAVFDDAG